MTIQDRQDQLSANYPAIETEGFRLHVFLDDGWEVWLNTDVADFDGLCIVTGEATRQAAIERAKSRFKDFWTLLGLAD